MKLIPLTKGQFAMVDDMDFEELSKLKWRFSRGYAVRWSIKIQGPKRMIYMHALIMSPPEGNEVDHKDGNGLNNQRDNLRNCTHTKNKYNSKMYSTNKLGVKGVSLFRGKFRATIQHSGQWVWLGDFKNLLEAKLAHETAALKYHGEFARFQ